MRRRINSNQPHPSKHTRTPNTQQNFPTVFPSKAKEGRPNFLCQLLESSFHGFHERKRRLVLFSWKDKFLMNVNVLLAPQFGGRDPCGLDSRSQEYNQLASCYFFFLSPPSEAQMLSPGPLFLSLPSAQPAETACLRRENSWWIGLTGLSSNNGSRSAPTNPPLCIYPGLFIKYLLGVRNCSISSFEQSDDIATLIIIIFLNPILQMENWSERSRAATVDL